MNSATIIYVCPDFGKVCEHGWCHPNKQFLQNVAIARGPKKRMLIDEVGELGPVIDILLRASITEMIVKYFGSDAKQIVSHKHLLKKHALSFSNDEIIIGEIKKWFECRKATHDFTLCYRSFRMKLLVAQLFTLITAPKTLVLSALDKWVPESCHIFQFNERTQSKAFCGIVGFDQRNECFLVEKSNGFIAEAVCLIEDAEVEINKILMEYNFYKEPFSFSTATDSLHKDLQKLFDFLNDFTEDTQSDKDHCKNIIINYIQNKFMKKLVKLDLLIVINAFLIDGEPIFDIFFKKVDSIRVMRTGKEMSHIFAGQLMTLFFKMIYLVHIADKKVGVNIKNVMDIFRTLQDDSDASIPSIVLFNNKVSESVKPYLWDCKPEIANKNVMILYKIVRSLNILKEYTDEVKTNDDIDTDDKENSEDEDASNVYPKFSHPIKTQFPNRSQSSKTNKVVVTTEEFYSKNLHKSYDGSELTSCEYKLNSHTKRCHESLKSSMFKHPCSDCDDDNVFEDSMIKRMKSNISKLIRTNDDDESVKQSIIDTVNKTKNSSSSSSSSKVAIKQENATKKRTK